VTDSNGLQFGHVWDMDKHPSGISVELLDFMGNDLSIVNAARVSYSNESWWEDAETLVLKKGDKGLINYLMNNRHGTPFEMVQFKFRAHVPIGVGREWMRHRIGSFNEVSTRYVKMEREYYTPQLVDWRTQVGKPGHYEFDVLDPQALEQCMQIYEAAMQFAFDAYEAMVTEGLAKEVARNVLPLGTFTTFIWSVNLRSLFNFLSLRTHETALREIRLAAEFVEKQARVRVPHAMQAWNENGRVAP
jgi:thymidylate synthase (FAD)